MISKRKKRVLMVLAAALFACLLAVEIFNKAIFSGIENGDLVYSVISRFVGGAACMIFIYVFVTPTLLSPKTNIKRFLIFLPCMAVAINNFPFISYFTGKAYIASDARHVMLFALTCLGVGFFEEMAFRGCIFTVLLQRRKKRRIDVFFAIVLSSVVFGAVHLVNVFAGASIGSVILQVGYSFLIGGMCSVVLVWTSNIWYCVILHAVYNFAGGVVPECGGGEIWPVSTVILTTVIAVAVAAYVIYLLVKTEPAQIDRLLDNKQVEE